MCEIVAYIGNRNAFEIVIKGLKRLEYRGYDGAGAALSDDNQINAFGICDTASIVIILLLI